MNKPTEEKEIFTILTKTGCKNCNTFKKYLDIQDLKYIYVNCDEYLENNNRDLFIEKIKEYTKSVEKVYFPIIFYEGKYLKEPYEFVDNLLNVF